MLPKHDGLSAAAPKGELAHPKNEPTNIQDQFLLYHSNPTYIFKRHNVGL